MSHPRCSCLLLLGAALLSLPAFAATPPHARPWLNASLTPDRRAAALVKAMTQDEKFRLIRSDYGSNLDDSGPQPPGGRHNAAFIPAMPRLGLPAIEETDAGMGVALQHAWGDGATALPSGLATAASFDPQIAEQGGAMIGSEAHRMGFNVLLAGGLDLVRDPRNGRNFEYAGEDPLLAGTMVGAAVRGIESQHVVSTIKHYALNDQETNRNAISAELDHTAARESDLLAFQIAIAEGKPGAVMCSYNRVDGEYACENDWLLNQVLKRDWKYPGFVMSDWGAVHSSAKAALAGLDQESAGNAFDKQVYFDQPLRAAVKSGEVPQARIDDMVYRIARSLFAAGVVDHPARQAPIDFAADARVSQRAAEAGAVLLRNHGALLPLSPKTVSIAVIGAHADKGVTTGGGSSAVVPRGGNAVPGLVPAIWPGPRIYQRSAPLAAIGRRVDGRVEYASGDDIAAAAKLAATSSVAVVFVQQWTAESFDVPTMALPGNQDALVSAIARVNPHTVVVLETNGPVSMPWLNHVDSVMEAWYPGANGGEAIARLLFGEVAPSGHLPVTWPRDDGQLPRPTIPGAGLAAIGIPPQGTPAASVDYNIEGADVGYRWFQRQHLAPLYPFGFGLTYTHFRYGTPRVAMRDGQVVMQVRVTNTGAREGVALPQLYVTPPGARTRRLAGWRRVELKPGQSRTVQITANPLRLAHYDTATHGWRRDAGSYRFQLGRSAADMIGEATLQLPAADGASHYRVGPRRAPGDVLDR
ncbi:MAG: beta-glucosidase [Rhodanobacter sp.]|nr:MAG: beta-glucosidase [Rhodanobacter sp.]